MKIFAQRRDQPHEQASSRLAQARAASFRPTLHSTPLLHLQRAIGNRAVHRMLETSADAHDARAAHVASVWRDGRPTLRRQPNPDARIPKTPPLETIPKKEEGEEKPSTPPAEAPANFHPAAGHYPVLRRVARSMNF